MIIFELSTGQGIELPLWSILTSIISSFGMTMAFYVLRSIGIYKLAKNNGIKNAGLAFVPGVWIYPACKLIGEARFFRTTIGRVAIVFTLIYSISIFGEIIYSALVFSPLVSYYIAGYNNGANIIISNSSSISGYSEYINGVFVSTSNFRFPFSEMGVLALDATNYLLSIVDAVATVILVFVYFAIFRKFWPEYHVLAAILSILGLFAPFVFAIRNRQAVNYASYVRSRMENYNSYGNNNYEEKKNQNNSDPFDNLGKDEKSNFNPKSDDPFDEF